MSTYKCVRVWLSPQTITLLCVSGTHYDTPSLQHSSPRTNLEARMSFSERKIRISSFPISNHTKWILWSAAQEGAETRKNLTWQPLKIGLPRLLKVKWTRYWILVTCERVCGWEVKGTCMKKCDVILLRMV